MVPGNASGGMNGVAVKPLTVGFHETLFLGKLNGENQLGFWFQLSDQERQQVGSPWGPSNPQALNRYSYVQNNPLKYIDPSGHFGVTYYGEYNDQGQFQWNGNLTLHLSQSDIEAMKDWSQEQWTFFVEAILFGVGLRGPQAAAMAGLIGGTLFAGQAGAMGLYLLSLLSGGNGLDFHLD